MKIELTDVYEYEFIRFAEQIASVDGLSDAQVDQINEVFADHGQARVSIARHHDGLEWEVWC